MFKLGKAWWLAVLAMGLSSPPSAALSQAIPKPGEASAGDTVTVIGQRKADQEVLQKIVSHFVDLHSARDRKSGLLVRETAAGICPVVLGLPRAYDDFVTARIAAVAKETGSPVQDIGKCEANIEVLFTNDPQGVVNMLSAKTGGMILGLHFVHELDHIVHVYRPVQAWYVTGTRGDPHTWNSAIDPSGDSNSVHTRMSFDTAYGPSPNTGTGSRIRPRTNSHIVNTLIVADLNKVGGLEIGPIADYMTLLALSQPASLDGCNDLPSILDVMSSGCANRAKPAALTDSDMAYLKSLYAADITTSAEYGRENVTKDMTQQLSADHPCAVAAQCPPSH